MNDSPSTDRKTNLYQQLQQAFKDFRPNFKPNNLIGSMTFWHDDYGASLEVIEWVPKEHPWGIMGANNISLEEFDVFESTDVEEIDSVCERFFDDIQNSDEFTSLSIREGFQFCFANYDEGPYPYGEPLKGLTAPYSFTTNSAVEYIFKLTEKLIIQTNHSPIKSIQISSSGCAISVDIVTDLSEERKDNNYHSFREMELGIALTKLSASSKENFKKMCEKIVESKSFQDFPKRPIVVFNLTVSSEEFFACVYETEKNILRYLDEDTELKFLY